MPIVKRLCVYCSPHPKPPAPSPRDSENHPSWIAGIEALNAYNDWVSSYVLPIAFQWIEEHKPEVYASVPEELKDDVGVVVAAAFRLIKELPVYKDGLDDQPGMDGHCKKGSHQYRGNIRGAGAAYRRHRQLRPRPVTLCFIDTSTK
jgi:hypothetical protein